MQQIFDQRYEKVSKKKADKSSPSKQGIFSDKEVRFIAMQIVDTLTALSKENVVHFDLKPANIMYNEDFGTVSDRQTEFSAGFA